MKEDMTTPLLIIQVVFDYFDVPLFYQRVRNRERKIVLARQVSMYYIRQTTKMSYTEIGEKFALDHATIIHGIKAVNNFRDTDRQFRSDMANICNKIQCKILEGRPAINEYVYAQYDTDNV